MWLYPEDDEDERILRKIFTPEAYRLVRRLKMKGISYELANIMADFINARLQVNPKPITADELIEIYQKSLREYKRKKSRKFYEEHRLI